MYQDRRKIIRFGIFAIVLVGVVMLSVSYFTSTRSVAITTKNVVSFSVSEQQGKPGKKITKPSASVRIKKGKTYIVSYTGTSGFATSTSIITPETTSVSIDPDYSAEKLGKMLDAEIGAINTAITASGTAIDTLYTIQRGTLSHFGEWYFTTLKYNGSTDDQSSDTLVVGLQKKQGTWTAVLTPDIIFTTAAYPDVSRDFINAGNDYHYLHVIPTEE